MQQPSLLRAAVGVSVIQLDPSNDELLAPTFSRNTRTPSARLAVRRELDSSPCVCFRSAAQRKMKCWIVFFIVSGQDSSELQRFNIEQL